MLRYLLNRLLGKTNITNAEAENTAEANITNNMWDGFPTASETRERSSESWKELSPQEILKEIEERRDSGNTTATFYKRKISKESLAKLQELGYTVIESNWSNGEPELNIKW